MHNQSRLVLIRHGQSTYNEKNLFTGLKDIKLTDKGICEAHEAALLIQHIEQLKEEEKQMKGHLNRLENDLDYIEFIAYSRFKMVKPGEKINRIKDYKTIK